MVMTRYGIARYGATRYGIDGLLPVATFRWPTRVAVFAMPQRSATFRFRSAP